MFKSASSKAHSVSLLNRLTAGIAQNDDTQKDSTSLLVAQLNQPKTKKVVKKRNKKISKQHKKESKELKRVKYELIGSKDPESLTPEHQKYLKRLVKRNKNLVLEEDNDLAALQQDILSFDKKKIKKNKGFKTKKNHPGLTPGLAPVDYESDSE